jgi:hypothetical protein
MQHLCNALALLMSYHLRGCHVKDVTTTCCSPAAHQDSKLHHFEPVKRSRPELGTTRCIVFTRGSRRAGSLAPGAMRSPECTERRRSKWNQIARLRAAPAEMGAAIIEEYNT